MTKKTQYVVKTQKIAITNPISTNWDTFSKIAGDMVHNAILIQNYAIRMHYLYLQEKYEYEKEIGVKISAKEYTQKFYGVSAYDTVINREIKDKFKYTQIAGDTLGQFVKQSISTFDTNSREVLSNNASLPNFRRDQPIPVRERSLRLNEEYQVYLPFITSDKAKELGFKGVNKQSFLVQLDARKNAKIVLDRILNGEYLMCDSKVQRTLDGKRFLLLSYKQPVKEVVKDEDVIVGVDLGINKVAYMAVNNSGQNFFIDGGELRAFRNRIQQRRKSMRNQLRACSHNRRGHGRKTLLKPLEKLRDKEANFNNLANHRYAKVIVEWAEKQGAGTIQLEDLSNIKDKRKENKKENKMLGEWTYRDLADKIESKAKEKGIKVVKIDPKYTSKLCNECKKIDVNNRNVKKYGQEFFQCVNKECNHKTNADLNAAKNIAIKDIDKYIDKLIKLEKIN